MKQQFEALSGSTMVEGYGLTEASPVCFSNPFEGENRAGSIGLPLPGLRAEIRDLEDPSRALPPGERGELCRRRAERDGRLLEPAGGDRGRCWAPTASCAPAMSGSWMPDGYVTLVDRIKDLILVSGFNVYPRVIEEALYRHPAIVRRDRRRHARRLPRRGRRGLRRAAARHERRPPRSCARSWPTSSTRSRCRAISRCGAHLPRTTVGKLSKKELKEEMLARPTTEQAA